MTVFYKFLTLNSASRVFKDKTLSWSKIEMFNDPFEGRFQINHSLAIQARFELLASLNAGCPSLLTPQMFSLYDDPNKKHPLLDEMFNTGQFILRLIEDEKLKDEFSINKFENAERQLIRYVSKTKYLVTEWTEKKELNFINPLRSELIRMFRNDLYVLCLSKNTSKKSCLQNNLMWAHYSDNNKGICLELSSDDLLTIEDCIISQKSKTCSEISFQPHKLVDLTLATNSHSNFFDVKYQNMLPIIEKDDLFGLNQDMHAKSNRLITKMIATKSSHWKYENEIRHVFIARPNANIGDRLICKIPNNSIKKIYLGSEFAKNFSNEHDMCKYISDIKKEIPNSEIIQTKISRDSYQYLFETV
ncbi:DUF2971 domain-containing protein [Providencia manganoxydans]|uniref:DUF2971 domain-containing protein n=1 Tax=Providencia manganoxydans TaxID=2923283 RepID=UPI0034E40247